MMEEEDKYSKRIRSNNNNNNNNTVSVAVDRISALPNCILGVILCFLPTKEAVATSVLSKRWKCSWLDVHNLDLSSRDFVLSEDIVLSPDSAEILTFISFVHRAFRLIHGRPLYKFILDWHTCVDSSHVISWINAAIRRNVHEITLYLGDGDIFRLPITGFNCHSLRSLRVDSIIFVNDTTMVCLPRLETLILNGRFTSEDAFEKLINGCPMLRYFELDVYSSFDDDIHEGEDFIYIVSSPSLRHLDMHMEVRCTLKLNAPSLEYLRLSGHISKIIGGKCLSSLIEARFDTYFDEHDFPHNLIVEAIRPLKHAKFLTLSANVLQALSRATISLSTEFKRLVKLEVGMYCCAVQDLILNSENLEDLTICKDYRLIRTSNPHDDSRWTVPVEVPRCLSKSLKTVQVDGYKGLEDKREMIRYILEHGTALEVMQIHCSSTEDGEKMLQEICEFPRKSPGCKVQFNVWPRKRKFQLLY